MSGPTMNEDSITESGINILSESSRLEGKIRLDKVSRVHGTLIGEIEAPAGSTLILGETALVQGKIQADTLVIDGYVKGEISASTRVVISGTGRVFGDIHTPSLAIEFGAHFEGRSFTGA